jgi:rhamnopyranosyl-N-acetylglucosaminyl-diphospho-decaprenol beta-1,3/1,4-galactofuranosyltransferase
MINNISTVIVTYNRKELLVKCIHAVLNQTLLPNRVYIVDNASTDGTKEILEKEGLLDKNVNGVDIHYERLPNNSGGAGGFYAGMKLAHGDGADAVWVMDDDGLPDKDCLKNLVPYLKNFNYISPMVIGIEDESMMAFEGCTVSEFLKRKEGGIVKDCANPFNGILYSKRLMDEIGYPKKEMFIWGDEINYDKRARKAGFQPVMVVNAIHRHPLNRQMTVNYLGQRTMTTSDKDWKLFCYIRNKIYNAKMFSPKSSCIKTILSDLFKFSCYFLLQDKKPAKLLIVLKAIYKGMAEDFSGLEKYMK